MKKKREKRQIGKRKIALLLEKSGLPLSPENTRKVMIQIGIVVNILLALLFLYHYGIKEEVSIVFLIVNFILLWTLGLVAVFLVIWLLFFTIVDLRIYKRKQKLEEVLPDFLQLTSANVRAGMTIDKALWHAIRPNFGILAKEMEEVAKETMAGTSLDDALRKFSKKYDSSLLQKSVSLLIEGLNAGGEIGDLLDKIATNIQEIRIMQREMSASVTTYVIFIGFASVVAAPFLFALSSNMIHVLATITAGIEMPEQSNAMFSFSKVAVSQADFRIFARLTLVMTSTMSAAIISVIRHGNVKEGIKYIPIFICASLLIFFALDYSVGLFVSELF